MLSSACATPYQAHGLRGGYEDYPAGANTIYIAFKGNGYTGGSRVTRYWHMRAAEVCGGEDKYLVVEMTQGGEVHEYGGDTTTYRGSATTYGNNTSYSGTATQSAPVRVTKYGADGYVRCVNGGFYDTNRKLSAGSGHQRISPPPTNTPRSEAAGEARAEELRLQRVRYQAPALAPAGPVPALTTGPTVPPMTSGCQYDTQCKGDRVCVHGQCVEPSVQSAPPSVPTGPTSTMGAADF